MASFLHNLAEENDGTFRYFPPGMPTCEDVIIYYADRTGRDVSTLAYYMVLSRWRIACMIEYKVAEAIQGLSSKAKGDRFDKLVRSLLSQSERLARSLG